MPKHFFSIDVESMGLLGKPFAVGWVVVDEQNDEKEEGYLRCSHNTKGVSLEDMEWMHENVFPHLSEANCEDLKELIDEFWAAWERANKKYENLTMVCDVPFPVETNFLSTCLQELGLGRNASPYPLIDVASVLLASGRDPLGDYDRHGKEFPAHHPTNDARQSARLLVEALRDLSPTVW